MKTNDATPEKYLGQHKAERDFRRFSFIYDFTEEQYQQIFDCTTYRKFKKGEIFNEVGKKSTEVGVVLTGHFASVHEPGKLKRIVSEMYSMGGMVVVMDFESLKEKKNSVQQIEAGMVSSLLVLNYQSIIILRHDIPNFDKMVNDFMENYIVRLKKEHNESLVYDKQEQMEHFRVDNKSLNGEMSVKDKKARVGADRSS
ncbi:MAG: hypothetical protein WCL14_13750 [Bacteroidota bacterium]